MKKLMFILLAAVAISSGAVQETVVRANESWYLSDPVVLKSVYVRNNSGVVGKSENVSVNCIYPFEYLRPYYMIGTEGQEFLQTNGIPITVLLGSGYYMFEFNGVLLKDSTDDPSGYVADFETNAWNTISSSILTDVWAKVRIRTYSSPETYKIKADLYCTNNMGAVYRYPVDAEYDIVGANLFDLPGILQNQNITGVGSSGNVTFSRWSWYPLAPYGFVTNRLYSKDQKFESQEKITFVSMNVGTTKFSITNGVDKVIPSKTFVTATATDPSTEVGIIYE